MSIIQIFKEIFAYLNQRGIVAVGSGIIAAILILTGNNFFGGIFAGIAIARNWDLINDNFTKMKKVENAIKIEKEDEKY